MLLPNSRAGGAHSCCCCVGDGVELVADEALHLQLGLPPLLQLLQHGPAGRGRACGSPQGCVRGGKKDGGRGYAVLQQQGGAGRSRAPSPSSRTHSSTFAAWNSGAMQAATSSRTHLYMLLQSPFIVQAAAALAGRGRRRCGSTVAGSCAKGGGQRAASEDQAGSVMPGAAEWGEAQSQSKGWWQPLTAGPAAGLGLFFLAGPVQGGRACCAVPCRSE